MFFLEITNILQIFFRLEYIDVSLIFRKILEKYERCVFPKDSFNQESFFLKLTKLNVLDT